MEEGVNKLVNDFGTDNFNNNNEVNNPSLENASSKKIWLFVGVVFVILLVALFLFWAGGDSKLQKEEVRDNNSSFSSNARDRGDRENVGAGEGSFQIEILPSKDSYEVGEIMEGEYHLSYVGEDFDGVVLYTFGRVGLDKEEYVIFRGVIKEGSFKDGTLSILRLVLRAFRLNENTWAISTDSFYEKGTYIYEMAVYDCSVIEATLGKDCSDAKRDEIAAITPLESKLKNIIVEGGQNPSECESSSDCTQPCIGCKDGAQFCEGISLVCMDCFIDMQCADGYICGDDDKCITGEPEEETVPETYPVTNPSTILDCYSENLDETLCDPWDMIGFTDLFEERLGPCEISEGTFALGWEPVKGIFRGYEIQEEQEDICVVKFWFLENSLIDSNLINKDMICEYNSSRRTPQDVNDCLVDCCSGDLFDAINVISE